MEHVGTVANYAEIISAVFVVGGLAFAAYELRQQRIMRRREAAYELFHTLSSKEFMIAINLLREMPEGLGRRDIEERYADRMEDIQMLMGQMEDIGVMVYDHILPLDLAIEFYGATIVGAWKKLGQCVKDMRDEAGHPRLYDYMQWLAETVERQPAYSDTPVHIKGKDWRPR